MDIERVRNLAGTNIWADFPVTEVWLDLSGIAADELEERCQRIRAGLAALLPGCRLPSLDSGQDATALEAWLGRSFARLTLALGGAEDGFLRVQPTGQAGLIIVALADRRGVLPPAYVHAALSLLATLRTEAPVDLAATLEDLSSATLKVRPTPSAAALAAAARARGIPARHLGNEVLQLGQGARQVRTWHAPHQGPGTSGWPTHERALMADLLASVGVGCTPAPITGSHYRVLVAGGQVAAAIGYTPQPGTEGIGRAVDLRDLVHPDVCARALDAARGLGLDIAEVRLAVDDPSQPLEVQGGRVSEVVASPALDPYLGLETRGPARRPVTDALLDALFPSGGNGRIPVAAVTGTNGKTTVTRLLAHTLALHGLHVGMTCTDGIYLGGRRIDTDDCAGPQSARLVLLNPQVEAAVLETARGGILREGLAFDLCDLAVVTNIGEGDHIGIGGVETLERLAAVKQTVVRAVAPWGTAVLNAADPLVAPMAKHCRGTVLFFAQDEANPVLARHRRGGGRVAFARGSTLVLAEGASEVIGIPLAEVPLTHGGRIRFQVENVLACAGGLWALGLPGTPSGRPWPPLAAMPTRPPGASMCSTSTAPRPSSTMATIRPPCSPWSRPWRVSPTADASPSIPPQGIGAISI